MNQPNDERNPLFSIGRAKIYPGMLAIPLLIIVGVIIWKSGIFGGGPDVTTVADGSGDAVTVAAVTPTTTLTDQSTGQQVAVVDPSRPAPTADMDSADLVFVGVEWPGYAPLLIANGNDLRTQPGSIFDRLGVDVQIVLEGLPQPLVDNFGFADCNWRTVDYFAQSRPGLLRNNMNASMVALVDNTQGGDAIFVGPNSSIRTVEDLAGARIALTPGTPSHFLVEFAITNSSLSERQRRQIRNNYVLVDSPSLAREALESGNADAAVLWEPDTTLAMRNLEGGRVVYSTADAQSLVYDGIVCNREYIQGNRAHVVNFVDGWLQAVELANENPMLAAQALVATEPMLATIAMEAGENGTLNLEPIFDMFETIVWTDLDDNVRYMNNGTFARIYNMARDVWMGTEFVDATAPNPPASGVVGDVEYGAAFDDSIIREVLNRRTVDTRQAIAVAAAAPTHEFSTQEREEVVTATTRPLQTQQVSIYFDTNSSELDADAKRVVATDIVRLLDTMSGSYFAVAGNTDSTGSRDINERISQNRAQALVDYLVNEWGYAEERFEVVGNGPNDPVCDEEGQVGADLIRCREQNRRTDIEVYTR